MKSKNIVKELALAVLFSISSMAAIAQNEFITHWKIQSNSINFVVNGIYGNYNYNIKWKVKGSSTYINELSNQQFNTTINTSAYQGDTIEVHITGNYYYFKVQQNDADNVELINVAQWGNLPLKSTQQMFKNCTNLKISATDAPNLSQVQYMHEMFSGCTQLNTNFNNWNVSNVTIMNSMFSGCQAYNQPLNNWNVGNVTEMEAMFFACQAFNQPLNSWNVGNVTRMNNMFRQTHNFNQPLNNWDVSKVQTMAGMFEQSEAFNQNIQSWNLALCTDLSGMFKNSKAFNSPLAGLNVSHVTNFSSMFYGAELFDQSLNGWTFASSGVTLNDMFSYSRKFNQVLNQWNLSGIQTMNNIFFASNMPYCTIDQNLNAWSQQLGAPTGVAFYGVASVASNAARNSLTTNKAWSFYLGTIVDIANNPITITFPEGLCASNANNTLQANNSNVYTWSTGQTGVSIPVPNNTPGTYSISVSDQCGNTSGTISYTVGLDTPEISLGPDIVICDIENQTQVTLTATGGVSYRWPGSSSFVTTDTYTLNVNLFDNLTIIVEGRSAFGCSAKDTIKIKKVVLPWNQINTPEDAVCGGTEVTLTGEYADAYTWKIYDSSNQLLETLVGSEVTYTTPFTAETSVTYNGQAILEYEQTGCVLTKPFTIVTNDCTLGLSTLKEENINVYPNPSKGKITIEGMGLNTYQVVNNMGQLVKEGIISSDIQELEISELEEGIYLLHLNGKTSSIHKLHIIK